MNWFHREPTLDEILSDSIVRALMEADGVDPQELAVTLRQAGLKLVRRARSVFQPSDWRTGLSSTPAPGAACLVAGDLSAKWLFCSALRHVVYMPGSRQSLRATIPLARLESSTD
jgi:hypothetical protein